MKSHQHLFGGYRSEDIPDCLVPMSGYLQKKDCQLINLVMRKSDVDDNEIGDFVQIIGDDRLILKYSLWLVYDFAFELRVALMQSLKGNHLLKYLDVSYHGLGQEGAEMLGDALHVNTTLRSVLVSNNITPRGCVCGVRSCRSLGFVDISNNHIGEMGAQAVMMGERVRMDIRDCSSRT